MELSFYVWAWVLRSAFQLFTQMTDFCEIIYEICTKEGFRNSAVKNVEDAQAWIVRVTMKSVDDEPF